MGVKSDSTRGEIVQVQGGHIIRATGLKDRHSKVFTAKGPRDRRVRLSAHTAIQFYDVQDRLGYDRPSKAVDWLIKKAKASIDKLAELPPWDPLATARGGSEHVQGSTDYDVGDHTGSSSFYVPQCVDDSQSIGDSMKCFFPTNTSQENSINFQNYPHQDLCLSLHTLQDPGNGNPNSQHDHTHDSNHDPSMLHGSGSSLGFDGDMGRFTRLLGWAGTGEERGGVMFNNPTLAPQSGLLLGQQQGLSSSYSQRGTLQSNNYAHLVRVFGDQHHNNHQEISGIGHGQDGLMGFYVPNQIHGGPYSLSNKASSSSLSPDSSQH
ncbi:unnamed protein product [Amaranthus hypochondriacus]